MTEPEVVYQTLPKYTVPVVLGLSLLACLACAVCTVARMVL